MGMNFGKGTMNMMRQMKHPMEMTHKNRHHHSISQQVLVEPWNELMESQQKYKNMIY